MKYTLTKLKLNDGKYSLVCAGHSTTGDTLTLFDYRTGEVVPIESVQEVIPDKQVLLTGGMGRQYHNTSMIKSVEKVGENTIRFETQTSVYELTQE